MATSEAAASALAEAALIASCLPQLASRLCQLAKLAADAAATVGHRQDLRASVKPLQAACLQLHDAWEAVAAHLRDIVGFGRLSRQLMSSAAAAMSAELAVAVDFEAAARAALETPAGHVTLAVDQLSGCCHRLRVGTAGVARVAGTLEPEGARLTSDAAEQLGRLLSWSGQGLETAAVDDEAEVDALSLRMLGASAQAEVQG